jgi:multisubunit Na+/H+ antiporter MnhB subunit
MKGEKQAGEQVQETMNSFDGITRAEPQPFLCTRLLARMQKTPVNFWERGARFLSRPAIAFGCVLLVLLMNGLVLLNNKTTEQTEILSDDYAADEANNTTALLFDLDNITEP